MYTYTNPNPPPHTHTHTSSICDSRAWTFFSASSIVVIRLVCRSTALPYLSIFCLALTRSTGAWLGIGLRLASQP